MTERPNIQWNPRIAGTVVLYRPDSDVIDNIKSFLNEIDILYVVDNSETINKKIIEQIQGLDKTVYISNGENLGIARALNMAANKAIEGGYDLLLTMDQDSNASLGMIDNMLECARDRDISKIGIIGPFHLLDMDEKKPVDVDCEIVAHTMTSGNLLNLRVYQTVGPFLDELFIDFVDIEFCLRLRQKGFLVVQANRAILKHNLGNISRVKILHKQLRTSNHSPVRRYYITRNRFFVWRKYRDLDVAKQTIIHDKISFRGEIRNILLMEKNKIAKLVMIAKGYLDYKRNIFGKYKD